MTTKRVGTNGIAGQRWGELQNILETLQNRLRLYKTSKLQIYFLTTHFSCFMHHFASGSYVLQGRAEACAVLDFLLTFLSRKK
jgi:hypothetical protein